MATNHKPETRTFHDFKEEDENNYDIVYSDQEDEYELANDDYDLPDLYKYLEALDTAETDLDGPHKPPSLFDQPEHKHNYNNISLLKYGVEEEKVHQYVDEFEADAKDDILHVGKISLEEIQEEEKRLRDEHIAFQQQELEREKSYKQELFGVEEETKKKVAQDLKEKRRQYARKVEIARQRERLQLDALHKCFKRAESRLITNLIAKRADIKTMYGDLSLADGEYGGAKGRRWTLDWIKTPHPVQIKLKALRGVKDKLPGGRYVLMVSLYNRLGGSVMKWSNLKGQQWGGATLPIIHNGNFFNFEMAINQSVFVVLPPKVSLRPSMMLVFELFLLRGSTVQTDKVVSWGCFPICDNNMDIIEGLYKAPFLRGDIDGGINKSTKIEELIASDLDHWMCNLYFEVVKLPRYVAGQKEYEVELQFSTELLNDPEKIKELGRVTPKTPKQYQESSELDLQEVDLPSDRKKDNAAVRTSLAHPRSPATPITRQGFNADLDDSNTLSSDITQKDVNAEHLEQDISAEFRKRPMTTYGSRFAKKEHQVHLDDSSSSDSEIDDMQILNMKSKDDVRFRPVKGVPELSYRRYLNSSDDIYAKKVYTMLPKSAILKKKRDRKRMTYQEKLKLHHASVKTEYKITKGENTRQFEHVRRQMLTELGLSNPQSREFWTMLIIFIISFFIRIYVHYIGQWLFLMAQSIPINSFQFLPYTVQVMYHNTLLHSVEELVVVAIGPLSVFAVFLLLVIFCAVTAKVLDTFPETVYKFILCFGVHSVLDPLFIAIVDLIIGSWDYPNLPTNTAVADFSKMYWHFVRTEGTGMGGIFTTVFIYAFTIFVSGSILYMYFMRLHNNGRMLDIYWRLHSSEKDIFVPYDLEVSSQELDTICKKAEQWRGEEGERRKISVYEYLWEEEYENRTGQTICNKEKTIHLSIHTVHLDGLRELYRHFLIVPEGAILEVFGETSADTNGGTRRGFSSQNLHTSQQSLHKVKGRQTVFTRAGFREDTTLNTRQTSRSRQSFDSGTSKTAWSVNEEKKTS